MTDRSTGERAALARMRLESEANVWIASASAAGIPHLVPLSLAWIDEHIVVATPSDTPTAQNAAANGRVRAALDGAADVVLFDCDVEVVPFETADASIVERYVTRVGWDPRDEPGSWSLLVLRPRRGQAWNSPSEFDGRNIVRNGRWHDA